MHIIKHCFTVSELYLLDIWVSKQQEFINLPLETKTPKKGERGAIHKWVQNQQRLACEVCLLLWRRISEKSMKCLKSRTEHACLNYPCYCWEKYGSFIFLFMVNSDSLYIFTGVLVLQDRFRPIWHKLKSFKR